MRGGEIICNTAPKFSLNDYKIVLLTNGKILKHHIFRSQFTDNCKITIENLFQNFKQVQYYNSVSNLSDHLVPLITIVPLNYSLVFGWSVLGISTVGLTVLTALILFKNA